MMAKRVVIYTDGACDPNPGPGGWAAILRYGSHEKVLSGGEPDTTNNRMELQAALSALQALKRPCDVTLHTDSEYLRRGITEWLAAWQRREWRTNSRKVVQNQDLWRALAVEIERHTVDWRWVRGHSGNPFNERVDRLARAAIPRRGPRETGVPEATGKTPDVELFTRASCLGASGPGGWAVVLRRGEEVTSLSGSRAEASANEMELHAAINGLRSLIEPSRARVYTVSKYLYQGMINWVAAWQTRGWTKRDGQPVRHQHLWLALQELASQHQVEWVLLPGSERPPASEQAAMLASHVAHDAKTAK